MTQTEVLTNLFLGKITLDEAKRQIPDISQRWKLDLALCSLAKGEINVKEAEQIIDLVRDYEERPTIPYQTMGVVAE